MRNRESNILRNVDWWIVIIYTIMVFAGWISIYAASYNFDDSSIFDMANRSGKQLMWIGLAFGLGGIIMLIETRVFETYAPLFYGIMIFILLVTIFIAPDIKGSRSWLVLGPVSIQPAEFGKFVTALMLGWLFSSYNFKFTKPKNFIKAVAIVILPILMIIMQKETGSALVYFAFIFVFYREGMTGLIMIAGLCAILFFVIDVKFGNEMIGSTELGTALVMQMILLLMAGMHFFYAESKKSGWIILGVTFVVDIAMYLMNINFINVNFAFVGISLIVLGSVYSLILFLQTRITRYLTIIFFSLAFVIFSYSVDYAFDNVLEPHQQTRIEVALGMKDDLKGAGYNVNQAKIAIGSGGLFGKGFLNGTQTKLKYVPEQDTDFIFCTIGEEEGFVGSSMVIVLFFLLISRLIFLAERQRSAFARIYGYSVASIFFFHLLVNVGMVIGLLPVIGIPLPFFSYGGSGLWSFSILLFIFLRLDASRLDHY